MSFLSNFFLFSLVSRFSCLGGLRSALARTDVLVNEMPMTLFGDERNERQACVVRRLFLSNRSWQMNYWCSTMFDATSFRPRRWPEVDIVISLTCYRSQHNAKSIRNWRQRERSECAAQPFSYRHSRRFLRHPRNGTREHIHTFPNCCSGFVLQINLHAIVRRSVPRGQTERNSISNATWIRFEFNYLSSANLHSCCCFANRPDRFASHQPLAYSN